MGTAFTVSLAAAASLALSTAAYAQSRDFALTGFEKIDISTGLDVRISQGEAFAVAATANSQRALDNLVLEVNDGLLHARFEQNFVDFILDAGLVGQLLRGGTVVTVDITMPSLSGLTASSGADIDIMTFTAERLIVDVSSGADISADNSAFGHLAVTASSGARVELSGTADSVEFDASSGAQIDADDLKAGRAIVAASSGAGISVRATRVERANASGGGNISFAE